MEIQTANKKQKQLKKDIQNLLQDFCEETGLQLGKKMEIESFYDSLKNKGSYTITLNIKNPFKDNHF